jgi:hypothetical protein
VIPARDELERLSKNVDFAKACDKTTCKNCDFSKRKEDCRELAREALGNDA